MPKKKHGYKRGDLSAKYLRITHWNMGGIISDVHGNKLEDSSFFKFD